MEENEEMSVDAGRGAPHRRTVLKGAAWSIPVIAAAAAVPAYAASPACAEGGTVTITGSGPNHAMQSVTLPKCARTVTYTVIGGNGGSGGGEGTGAGAAITGTFLVSGGETLTLVAGGGGRGSGYHHVAQVPVVRATGFGNGGVGGSLDGRMMGSGGGAGSAIMLGPGWTGVDNPLVLAAGGGGEGSGFLSVGGIGVDFGVYGPDAEYWGGSAGTTAGAGGRKGTKENQPGSAIHPAYGGGGATISSPGAGGTWSVGSGGSANVTVGGTSGNPGVGYVGGDGVPSTYLANTGAGWTAVGSGGGGGGWKGGGSGAVTWVSASGTTNTAGGAASGGAGSNYYGGATPGAAAVNGSVTIPYPTSITQSPTPRTVARVIDPAYYWIKTFDGNPGSVTISWS